MNLSSLRPGISVLCLFGAIISGCGPKPEVTATDPDPTPAAPTVQVVAAKYGTLDQSLSTSGTLAALPTNEATVSPSVAGVLDALSAHFGQSVTKGEVIAHLSDQTVTGQIQQADATVNQNILQVQQAQIGAIQQRAQGEASIEQAQAAVSNAQATLASDEAVLTGNQAAVDNAKQNLTRAQSLFQNGLVAQKDIEAAQLALNTAVAQANAQKQTIEAQKQTVAGQEHALNAAKTVRMQNQIKSQDIQIARQQVVNASGALRTARAQLSLYTLHAPLSGRVTAVGASLGEAVDTTTKLVTITNLDTLQLQISVPAASSSLVHPGQSVTFHADSYPGIAFHTTIETVGSQVDATTGAVTAFAIVPNGGHRLKDDQIVKVIVTTDRRPGSLIVPKSSVLIDPDTGKRTIAVIGSDQVLHIRPVSTGLVVGDLEEVTNGLQAGETVAVSGQYAVPDSTKVSVVRGS